MARGGLTALVLADYSSVVARWGLGAWVGLAAWGWTACVGEVVPASGCEGSCQAPPEVICEPGYRPEGGGCVRVPDPCLERGLACDERAACIETDGRYRCECQAGWTGSGLSCSDIDECAASTDNCSSNGSCRNLPGSFACSCNPGFDGNGVSCLDVDECSAGTDRCDINATCTNTEGSYRCTCESGFTGDGQVCEPSFDIVLVFEQTPEPSVRSVFERAEERWEALILEDIPDVSPPRSVLSQCGVPDDVTRIDDLLIYVRIVPIDGLSRILGQASPRCIRDGSGLPFFGVMTFDSDDVEFLGAQERLDSVVLHEMGHVLGIGTLWRARGLLEAPSCVDTDVGDGSDTRFVGRAASSAWQDLGGSGGVPVENVRGQGSCDGHWREAGAMQLELMSSSLSASNFLSAITLGSLADLGYETASMDRADPFVLGPFFLGSESSFAPLDLHNDLGTEPMYRWREGEGLILEPR